MQRLYDMPAGMQGDTVVVIEPVCIMQEREVLTCRSKYQTLSSTCSETGYYNVTGESPQQCRPRRHPLLNIVAYTWLVHHG